MRRYARATVDPFRPIGEINTTPLIDVMLVLLIMIILTIPVLTHTLEVPLPTAPGTLAIKAANTISIDRQDRLYWNGAPLGRQQLLNQLASSAAMVQQPVIRFEPDADASYDQAAKTIALIKDSGIETFAFVGNHRYRNFDGAD